MDGQGWQIHRAVRSVAGAAGLRGCAACLRRALPETEVSVVRRTTGASFAGLQRCASPWSCWACSRALGTKRAEVARRVLDAAAAAGVEAHLVTLTVRHEAGQRLVDVLETVMGTWRSLWAGRAAARWAHLGLLGALRSVEVTHGAAGWHPHLHAVVLGSSSAAAAIVQRWLEALPSARPQAQSIERINLADAGSRERAASYASKGSTVETCSRAAAAELAQGAHKSSVHGRTVAQLMRDCASGDTRARALLQEYMIATKGRRAWHVVRARSIERELGVSLRVADTAKELQASDAEGQVVVKLDGEAWYAVRKLRAERAILDLAERMPKQLQMLVAGAWGDFAEALGALLPAAQAQQYDHVA